MNKTIFLLVGVAHWSACSTTENEEEPSVVSSDLIPNLTKSLPPLLLLKLLEKGMNGVKGRFG